MKMSYSRKLVRRLAVIAAMTAYASFTVCPAMAFRRPDHEIDKITAAIDALDAAHKELHEAADDFHGHKKAAMEKIETAKATLEKSRDAHVEKASRRSPKRWTNWTRARTAITRGIIRKSTLPRRLSSQLRNNFRLFDEAPEFGFNCGVP